MPKLRRLSGREALAVLGRFGFERVSRRGSHVKLARVGPAGERQVLTVPDHATMDLGTIRAIFRQASRFIPADQLRVFFYDD
jgi:predicted RNA binding protein YcfA (HicA-like mRNA interferase family)